MNVLLNLNPKLRWIGCWLPFLFLASLPEALAADQAGYDSSEILFTRYVSTILREKCVGCHGADPDLIEGGLDLRSLETAKAGGDSGSAGIVPGEPGQSSVYLAALRGEEDFSAMPPKESEQLDEQQLKYLEDWIRSGANWPNIERQAEIESAMGDAWSAQDGIRVPTTGALSEAWARRKYDPAGLWAYQPLRKPDVPALNKNIDSGASTVNRDTPHVQKDAIVRGHPVDAFLAAKMPDDVQPARPAEPRVLIRRITFDLTGLPPTPGEVEDFVAAYHSDRHAAVETVIDRLLASPQYGVRYAQHWLDVVRYADSSGFANDYQRGNAWRYRDYVVRAFNEDKPYDEFVREQIAGDELSQHSKDAQQRAEQIIATGMLRMGPWELTGMEIPKIARQRFLDDVTNSVGVTFLAQPLECAKCHDHKFDPIPTHDYYAFQACFATTQFAERSVSFLDVENTRGFEEREDLMILRRQYEAQLKRLDEKSMALADRWFEQEGRARGEWDDAVATVKKRMALGGRKSFQEVRGVYTAARHELEKRGIPESDYPPWGLGYTPDDFGLQRVAEKGLQQIGWIEERYEPYAFAVYSGLSIPRVAVTRPIRMPADPLSKGELEQTAILRGGDPMAPTTDVQPGTLSLLHSTPGLSGELTSEIVGRRTDLANWIADEDNPLTARTIVNRIWMWHFGQAIAGNPNNFGSTGKRPTHPELLDWLATNLIDNGWSIKQLHRLIMTSQAYQRSCQIDSNHPRQDLEAAYAVFRPRRLSSEEIRDAMLAISGELNPAIGGIPNRPEINREVAMQPRQVMGTFAAAWVPNRLPDERNRRSLYALRLRGLRDPFREVFNDPGPDFSCEQRDVSTVTPQVFAMFNSEISYKRALAIADRLMRDGSNDPAIIKSLFMLAYQRPPTPTQLQQCLSHWQNMVPLQARIDYAPEDVPTRIVRKAVEENTGEKFEFEELLPGYRDYVHDLQPHEVDAKTRALADVCLAILNTSEFVYVY